MPGPVFRLIQLPFCTVIAADEWNAPPHRYFASFRIQGSFRYVLGLPVISEFATISSPIFLCPAEILGRIYNAGLTLGHKRDPEMPMDSGWPPLCVGTEDKVENVPENAEELVLDAVKAGEQRLASEGIRPVELFLQDLDEFQVQFARFASICVYATDAPLSPKQLRRICELRQVPFSIAFSTGNRITRQEKGTPVTIKVVSEEFLEKLLNKFRPAS